MAISGLKIDVRRKKILDLLQRDGQVRVSELSETLNATTVTIRSDLDLLERDGLLERTQGGAIQTVKNFYNMDFLRRKYENMDYKKSIAFVAAQMVNDGDTLMINSGSTAYLTAIELKKYKSLNIVTNSLTVAIELGAVPTFRVILLGGDINAQYNFSYGDDARDQLKRYKASYAILSIDGICPRAGLTTYHPEETAVLRDMMDRSHQTIVVGDSTKLGVESFSYICDLSKVNTWVTNRVDNEDIVNEIRNMGVQVIQADKTN